jgi:hypothetical protein
VINPATNLVPSSCQEVVVGGALQRISRRLTRRGSSLNREPPFVRANPVLVAAALERNGLDLQFADLTFRDDPKFVKRAMFQNREALQFASERLRGDTKFMLQLTHSFWAGAVNYASDSLRNDPNFRKKARQANPAVRFLSRSRRSREADRYDASSDS